MKIGKLFRLLSIVFVLIVLTSCADNVGHTFPTLDISDTSVVASSIIDPSREVRGVWIA